MENIHHPTILIDLDGCIIYQQAPPWRDKMVVLRGMSDWLKKLWNDGAQIIICTGRPECIRKRTARELDEAGIYYHQLVMGLTSGRRYLVNDRKPYANNFETAVAINLERDKGLPASLQPLS